MPALEKQREEEHADQPASPVNELTPHTKLRFGTVSHNSPPSPCLWASWPTFCLYVFKDSKDLTCMESLIMNTRVTPTSALPISPHLCLLSCPECLLGAGLCPMPFWHPSKPRSAQNLTGANNAQKIIPAWTWNPR